MSKVNWVNARIRYCADENATYDSVAKMYGVAKSTITRKAAKERWPQLRQEYQTERHKQLSKVNINKQNEVEERHLKTIRIAIDTAHNAIVKIAINVANGTQSPKEARQLNSLTTALYKNIILERTILGHTTKPVVFRNSDDIDDYLVAEGFKEPPVNSSYKDLQKASESLAHMIERQKMIDGMIEDSNRQGRYS